MTITLQDGYSLTTLLALAAGAVGLTALLYWQVYAALRPRQWRALLALRAVAIVVLLLLWFRPVFRLQREVVERRAVVFLLDTSASMSVADGASGDSRFEQARARLLDWSGKLQDDFQLHWVTFAETATPLGGAGETSGLQADGQATSLSRALAAAKRAVRDSEVEAAVLLSDGVHNSAGAPLVEARKLGFPVLAVGVGAPLGRRGSFRDIRVVDLECPDKLPANNRVRLTGFVDAVGLAGRVVTAQLEEDGQAVAKQELALDDVEGPQPAVFEFVPANKGLHTYTVRVPPVAEEKIGENNHRAVSAMVVDPRIRVLYVEGTLRAEYGALVGQFLTKDPDVEFCALVQTRPNVFTQRSNIEDLKLEGIPADKETLELFDVYLLGDLDSSYLKPAQMQLLRDRVRNGAGLLMMGGYHSLGPGGYGGSPLEEVLPVFVGGRETDQIGEPFLPLLTPQGRDHPIFANIRGFFPTADADAEVAGLPPLAGCVTTGRAKPGAAVLAVHPAAEADGNPTVIMAVQRFGDGRSAVFTGDTTRNWSQALRAQDRETPFLRFWGQTVRWLAGRSEAVEPQASVLASTDRGYYEPEAPITISATVRNQRGEGAGQAQVTAALTLPDGKSESLPLAAVPGPAGHYQATFEPQTPGAYQIAVSARLEGETLEAEKLAVSVGRPNLEFDRLDLDEGLLTALAQETGGQYAHISTADRLIDGLNRKQQRRKVELEARLYWPPLFWLVFVAALCSEWWLRRRCQLR